MNTRHRRPIQQDSHPMQRCQENCSCPRLHRAALSLLLSGPSENSSHVRHRQSHVFGNDLYVAHDRRVENLRIAARHVDIGMAEHLGDVVDRGAAGQCQGCERMARAMRRKILADAADVGQFFQITV